jgi:hypothetical protein
LFYLSLFIERDILTALEPIDDIIVDVRNVTSSGGKIMVTVWFSSGAQPSQPAYDGDLRTAVRGGLGRQIMTTGSPFQQTYTGRFVDPDSYRTQDPPHQEADGAVSIVPSVLTFVLTFLVCMLSGRL